MHLRLYSHPFASFCQKVLIALYEHDTPFEQQVVDLGDPQQAAALKALWPIGRFPVLHDEKNGDVVAESSIIIEYLDQRHARGERLVPADRDAALEVRRWDRFFDTYVMEPMQKIVTDRLRPDDGHDSIGVAQARQLLDTAYDILDDVLASRTWAAGETFSLADCAAAPALYYAALVQPFAPAHAHLAAYYARLAARPSFARVVAEAAPYRHLFPQERQPS